MDDGREAPRLQRVTASDRGPAGLGAIVAVALLIAILKPWSSVAQPMDRGTPVATAGPDDALTSRSSSAPGPDAAADSPAAVPAPSVPPGAIDCRGPVGWRLATLERSPLGMTRSWVVMEPASAHLPTDRAIVPIRLPEADILALGFCGDGQAADTPQAAVVRGWQRSSTGAWLPLELPPAAFPDVGGAIAAVYPPPRPSGARVFPVPDARRVGASATVWPDGRYRFEVGFRGTHAWFGLDVGSAAW